MNCRRLRRLSSSALFGYKSILVSQSSVSQSDKHTLPAVSITNLAFETGKSHLRFLSRQVETEAARPNTTPKHVSWVQFQFKGGVTPPTFHRVDLGPTGEATQAVGPNFASLKA